MRRNEALEVGVIEDDPPSEAVKGQTALNREYAHAQDGRGLFDRESLPALGRSFGLLHHPYPRKCGLTLLPR